MFNNNLIRVSIRGLLIATMIVVGLFVFGPHVYAQDGSDPNLVVNGSLERPYYGQGSATRTAPQGWNIWVGAGAPEAFPHTDQLQVLDGEVSWNVKQGFTAFTAAGYQRVGGLSAGDVLRLTAYGWVYTCNNTETSCVIEAVPYRQSDTSAGAALKVGIDPTGGTNPNSADVEWSATAAPYDQWAEMSVTATAAGEAVTVFLHMTQSNGLALNNVYWDNVSLVRTDESPSEPEQQFAPFVVPQSVRSDGSIVHVVQAGDTLSSIAYAYSEYGVTIEQIAELNEGINPNTRFLQLGQEITILPPGSVDPATGEVVTGSGQAPAATQTSQAPASPADQPSQPTELPPTVTVVETPVPANYDIVQAAFMPFERGYMFWRQDTNEIYVLANETDEFSGTYSVYQDTWREGMPETDPNIQAPEEFIQPERGFGQAWRTYPGVRDSLGWGISSTQGYTALIVSDQADIVVNGPNNRVYRMNADSSWEAIDLHLPEDQAQAAP